jgi:hypothetical protein
MSNVFETVQQYKQLKQTLFEIEDKINDLLEEPECNFQGSKYLNLALEKIEFGINGLEYFHKITDRFNEDDYEKCYEPYIIKIDGIIRQLEAILIDIYPTGDDGIIVIKDELKKAVIWLNTELFRYAAVLKAKS